MTPNIFKIALTTTLAITLAACGGGGGGSDTPATDTPPAEPPETPTAPPSPGGDLPPVSDTKAGTYFGTFGFGDGVYVIDNDNNLAGLAVAADGSATSLFGNVGDGNSFNGTFRQYNHPASTPSTAGIFAAGDPQTISANYDLNIVNGQTIESLSGPSASLIGASGTVMVADAASLAGDFQGRHRFCITPDDCPELVTDINFNGSSVNGSTRVVQSDGEDTFIVPIAGTLSDFSEGALISFEWNSNVYNGVVFFIPDGSGRVVMIGETSAEVDNQTIASLMTRQ